jgi:Zn-dependent protease with chaperone function
MSAYVSFLTILGWSLMDSIWQMAILWMAYYMLTAGNIRLSSAGKHNLILVFVFIGAEWFVYTLIHFLDEPAKLLVPGFIPVSTLAGRWIPNLSLVYLVVLLFRSLQYITHSYTRRKNKPGKFLSPELQSFAERYTKLLGITKRVHVYLSDFAETAQTSGFFKPFILLPISLVTRLSPKQVEAILIHEIFHIRRNDYLINICMSCFRSIFFFNPFAHLFYHALARERELACDDGVIELGFAPDQYAEALFCLEKFRQVKHGFSLAANGNKPWLLMERICRILGKPARKKNRFDPLIFFSLLAAIALCGLQQKPLNHGDKTFQVAALGVPAIPLYFEFEQEKINRSKEIAARPSFQRRPFKKSRVKPIRPQTIPETPSSEDPETGIQAVFANNKKLINFTNQEAAVSNQAPILSSPGTPYLPTVSLSYEAIPEVIRQDSVRDLTVQNGLKDLITANRINTIAKLEALGSEIEKNSIQLKEIEIKNRKLILLDQKNIKPLLEEIHRQIRLKKQIIEHLKVRLLISETEIIHI